MPRNLEEEAKPLQRELLDMVVSLRRGCAYILSVEQGILSVVLQSFVFFIRYSYLQVFVYHLCIRWNSFLECCYRNAVIISHNNHFTEAHISSLLHTPHTTHHSTPTMPPQDTTINNHNRRQEDCWFIQ